MIKEYVKFKDSVFTMDRWINSPSGKLKIYLFNVTNAEELLSGRDEKVHLEQIGPITYKINSHNYIINRTKDSLTYRKDPYRNFNFMPFESISPDILNNTIVQLYLRINQVFTVNIGMKHGMENFFRIQTFKGERLISSFDWTSVSDDCAINVQGAFDNSLFPPFITKNTSLNIMAFQLCRVIPLQYQREEILHGLHGYRYVLMPPKETKCFSKVYGETLPKDMFDISNCVRMPWLEKVPTAFSAPHFYGSSYNWSEHFEGLNPNAEEHEPFILLEPTTGVKINERIRFQSNTILPDLRNMYNGLQRLSNKIVPNFWYEFEMDELPFNVRFIIFLNAYAIKDIFQKMLLIG
ncbi:platelet glycoprotein 4-like [Drosophila albomicans]|uniref:Platelet glycoprotein 4-like n=1 Tax=Drosophila albomicans TaxID=7291 RepID=A0A9C6SU64_DROAB|nr:platelet glycoprotein 4-like [Drosophila albomicans]